MSKVSKEKKGRRKIRTIEIYIANLCLLSYFYFQRSAFNFVVIHIFVLPYTQAHTHTNKKKVKGSWKILKHANNIYPFLIIFFLCMTDDTFSIFVQYGIVTIKRNIYLEPPRMWTRSLIVLQRPYSNYAQLKLVVVTYSKSVCSWNFSTFYLVSISFSSLLWCISEIILFQC